VEGDSSSPRARRWVDESINGFDTTANGRTQAITGTFTIGGTAVSAGQFTVDMTTFKSDESRRDGQFNGRIMDVANFPTATFELTAPIDFQQVPTDGTTITASATGDLTLRGTTQSVTFDVEATFQNGRVGVLGKIPVVFADFGIPSPSVATITTEDNGSLGVRPHLRQGSDSRDRVKAGQRHGPSASSHAPA
jgi:polyisoprenoid-binding protein YceI